METKENKYVQYKFDVYKLMKTTMQFVKKKKLNI